MEPLYYECHVTVEPVFDNALEIFKNVCKKQGFKAANLLMQKDRGSTPERSDKDTFATGQDEEFINLQSRMHSLLGDLMMGGFKVWRYKIEAILLDQKLDRNEEALKYDQVKWDGDNFVMRGETGVVEWNEDKQCWVPIQEGKKNDHHGEYFGDIPIK